MHSGLRTRSDHPINSRRSAAIPTRYSPHPVGMSPNQILARNIFGVATTIAAATTIALWLGAPSRHPAAPTFRPGAAAAETRSPLELGAQVYEAKGCVACHTIDGSPRVGPTFKGS